MGLVRKCEELNNMSKKKYSDIVWKEKLWGQIGEESKSELSFNVFFIAHFEVIIIIIIFIYCNWVVTRWQWLFCM